MSLSVICTIAGVVWREMLRKKDVYVLLILLIVLLVSLLVVNVFGLKGVAGYVTDLGLSFAWLFSWILAVLVSARQLPAEEKQGTIFSLLAKPITRGELVAGKWLGAWSVTMAATLCFYAMIIAVVAIRTEGDISLPPQVMLQAVLLHVAVLGVICAIALALSTRMNFDAAATFCFVLTGACLVLVPSIPEYLLKAEGVQAAALTSLWHLMPHFEVFDLRQRVVYDAAPAQWSVVGQVLVYGAMMTCAVLILAWLGYRDKKFRRGDAL